MIKKYFEVLKKNRELFEKADEIAREVKERAKKLFDDCEVYIVGSYAKKEFTLSSDLDILIVSSKIPEKFSFEWYSEIVKSLTDDNRINIHLVSRKKFDNLKSLYRPRIPVD
ncbi:DNA polymerase beta domain protein region [Ferroglobus placidus DSM 10642]|uniref:DNA polymerase beta domain protein region n=1 Tax=Ferroglobus placidus (strain DSM 10642 / AEDII12DO) TaxID=589924 RepID=D3RYL5_FERPA|nr:nucleotidyltransferase domain-containing protein [Ferroglobus placidus]ADC65578.1 DNA polymerase beta domain protein region [Ferroglobus placidus DSM 10642]